MAVKRFYFFGSYSSGYDLNNFIVEIDTDITGTGTTTGSGQFQVYTEGSYNVIATNEDGVTVDNLGAFSGSGDKTFTFSKGGKWVLEFSNGIERIAFNNSRDRAKALEIKQWGTAQWTTMQVAFNGCFNMNVTAVDVPDLSSVTNASNMFAGTSLTTLNVSNWDVSSVTNMGYMFYGCTSLTTLDVSNWDVSSVTNMTSMFQLCSNFTSDIDFSDPITGSISLTNISGMMAGTKSERLLLQAGNLLSPTNIAGSPSNWIASPNMKEVKLIGMKNDVDTTIGLGSAGAMTGEAWTDLLESFDISQSKIYKLSPTAYLDMETYVQSLGYTDIPDYLVNTGNNWTVIS